MPSQHAKHFLLSIVFLALPASTSYQLRDFGFGSGGTAGSSSANYSLEGMSGEQSGGGLSSTNTKIGSGFIYTQQAQVPAGPVVTNDANWYSKLHIVLAPGSNPSDTRFAIAVSTDNFVTTKYVQDDFRLGSLLGPEDYQTYSVFGGASGFLLLGLDPGTTYQVKVKAWQGRFTETGYGPIVSASTVFPQLTFDIDVASSDTETTDPFMTGVGTLLPNTVTASTEKIWADFDTNAENGGTVFVSAINSGLRSTTANYTIPSVNANLVAVNEGFGAQGVSATQGSGGPFTIDSNFLLSGDMVTSLGNITRSVFSSPSPVTSGRGAFQVKAKVSSTTPAANDYQEVITVVSSANF